jgi:hypothetical protein
LVERIRAVDPHLDVVYRGSHRPASPSGDHTAPVSRTLAQAAERAALRGRRFGGRPQRHAVDV